MIGVWQKQAIWERKMFDNEQEEYAKAIENYQKAIELNPKDSDAYARLGDEYK